MEWKALENDYLAWMQEEKKQVEKRMEVLRFQGCGDDAMLEKIRLNIYDAFEAVIRAGEKQKAGEEIAFCLSRLEGIPAMWEEKLKKAQLHENAREVAIESVKLETARHLREKFIEGMEA
ncbi:MAG: hypothetical protein E7329_01225 [Clostridiales bacterium]|nr:hypothetical protein [Clostridiales bacterium]